MIGGHGGFGHGGFGHGGFGHGGPGGSGPSGRRAQQPGLPFGGVPEEMQEGVDALLQGEPEHDPPEAPFSHVSPPCPPLTLARLLAPHRWAIVLGIVLVAVETVAAQVGPLLTQQAIDKGIVPRRFSAVALAAALYVGAVVVHSAVGGARISWTGRVGQRLMEELRIRVFSHIQRLSIGFFTDERSGRIMARMTSDIDALNELLQDGIVNLAVHTLTLVVVIGALFALDVELATVVVLTVIPAMVILTLWFRSASARAYRTVRDRVGDVVADLQESLAGIRLIAAFNRQRYDAVRHRDVVGRHRRANEHAARVAAGYGPGSDALGGLGQALILAVGGWMVLRGGPVGSGGDGLSIGELTAFVLYLSAFFGPIQHLVHLYDGYQAGQAAVAKLRGLLATEPSVAEREDAVELPPVHGAIALEGVTFAYGDGEPVLHDVSLAVAPGETIALVGPTGAGKSTIARLLIRFYDPQQGRVVVDGHDVRGVTLASLRRQLGVVPQEPFLFAASLRDNIAFARPDTDDETVMEACRAVGLDELVARLPSGLDTPVLERGVSLSSGERQLVALARAFLAGPRVLILDEATSSLDLRSEACIERALDTLLAGRTAVLIAHRLSTAMRADRIAVVDAGRIVELGTHAELVDAGGQYARMVSTWQSAGGTPPRQDPFGEGSSEGDGEVTASAAPPVPR